MRRHVLAEACSPSCLQDYPFDGRGMEGTAAASRKEQRVRLWVGCEQVTPQTAGQEDSAGLVAFAEDRELAAGGTWLEIRAAGSGQLVHAQPGHVQQTEEQ